jgi:hypothetical protein
MLIRDVAYAGITKENRADLHERHAAWLEQRNEADELVGYHAEQAHRYRRELQPGDPSWPGLRPGRATIWRRRGFEHGSAPTRLLRSTSAAPQRSCRPDRSE